MFSSVGLEVVDVSTLIVVSTADGSDVGVRTRESTELLFRNEIFDGCEKDANGSNDFSICFICLRCQKRAPIITVTTPIKATPTPIRIYMCIGICFDGKDAPSEIHFPC